MHIVSIIHINFCVTLSLYNLRIVIVKECFTLLMLALLLSTILREDLTDTPHFLYCIFDSMLQEVLVNIAFTNSKKNRSSLQYITMCIHVYKWIVMMLYTNDNIVTMYSLMVMTWLVWSWTLMQPVDYPLMCIVLQCKIGNSSLILVRHLL